MSEQEIEIVAQGLGEPPRIEPASDLGVLHGGGFHHHFHGFIPFNTFVQPWWFGTDFVERPWRGVGVERVIVRVTDETGRVSQVQGDVSIDRVTLALDVANTQIVGTIPAKNVVEMFGPTGRKLLATRLYDNTLGQFLGTLGFRLQVEGPAGP